MSQENRANQSDAGGCHTIRLNSAWELRLLPTPVEKLTLDDAIQGSSPAGRVSLGRHFDQPIAGEIVSVVATRRFNRPSNLSAGQDVSLQIEGLPPRAMLYFNGRQIDIAARKTHTVPIADWISDNNRIDVVAEDAGFLTGGQAKLVIEEGNPK